VLTSYLLPRIGRRRVIRVTLVGYCAAAPVVGLVTAGGAGLGYSASALAMVIVRLSGNRLLDRFPPSHRFAALVVSRRLPLRLGLRSASRPTRSRGSACSGVAWSRSSRRSSPPRVESEPFSRHGLPRPPRRAAG
jgi:hypothetical protein